MAYTATPMMNALHPVTSVQSLEHIRAAFPALDRVHGGARVAYFDGPGGTQVPHVVADAVADYLLHHNANTHWRYPTSEETDAAIQDAREWMAALLGADAAEVAFGANMTTLTFHVARALGRAWGLGDEIIVTELDHHANIAPWEALAVERGVTVRTARMLADTGELDWSDLERLVTPQTRLIAIGAASNALGTITDVRRAGDLVHAVGGLLFVDAVHYAPHVLVDVSALGCDLLACSAYKFYGPHVGVLYGRRALLESLDVPRLLPAPNTAPDRLETGTQNHEGIVGVSRTVRFLASLSGIDAPRPALEATFAALHARGQQLLEQMWAGLTAIPGVILYGPPPGRPRTPTVSFAVSARHPGGVAAALADRGVFVSHGDFYAATVIARLGRAPEGLVRAGCACYTGSEEVARLVDGVRSIAGGATSP
jgi:cysteine desulfurase family protein (TIGR01976 family)